MAFSLDDAMKQTQLLKWVLAFLMMAGIFWFSSQPSTALPDFSWADTIVKKGGHVLGYALLAFSYLYAFGMGPKKRWLAWLFAVFYAATDEFHQSFVPGRHPSVWDILIFDNPGALMSLWIAGRYIKQKRPDESA